MNDDFASLVGTKAKAKTARPGYAQTSPAHITDSPLARKISGDCRSWITADGTYQGVAAVTKELPCGLYEGIMTQQGPNLKLMPNNIDSLIDLPDSESERLLREVVQFRGLEDKFASHGFLYKRGILLWGPPGSGKTVTIQQLLKLFVENGGGVAYMMQNPDIATECLKMIRKIEPDRQILVIIEDIDALIDQYGEPGFLNLLDGESQLQNVVYVATTNYPERLDKRFVDRPSRFDTIRYIGMPTDEARSVYLQTKMPDASELTVARYVKATPDFSIAYLREFVVLTECFGIEFDAALERLRKMHKTQPKSGSENAGSFGFGG